MAGEVQKLVVGIHYVVNKASQAAALRFHDGVERSFKGIEQSIRWINQNADAMWKGLGRGAGALSATFAALAGGTAVVSHDIVRQQDYARSLATTVDEWSRWEHAGMRARVESQDFRAALISLTGAIEQAGTGSEDTQKLFQRLGVSWKDVDGNLRTSLDLLPELADGMNKLSDGDKAAAMVKIFGEDDGAKLFNLISLGSAGMEELRMEADRLGVTIDQGTADAAIRLQSTLAKLYGSLKGVGLQLFREVGPTFERLAAGLAALFDNSEGWLRLGLDSGIRKLGVAFRGLESPVGMAAAALLSVGAIFVGAQATLSVPVLGSVSSALVGVSRGLVSVTGAALGLLGIPLAPFALALAGVTAAVGALYLIWDEFVVTAEGGDSIIRRLADSLGVGAETADLFAAIVDSVYAGLEQAVGVAQAFGNVITFGAGALQTGAAALWDWSRALAAIVIPEPLLRLVDALLAASPTDVLRALIVGTTGAIEASTATTRSDTAAFQGATGVISASEAGAERRYQGAIARRALPEARRGEERAAAVAGAVVTQAITVQVAGTSATAEEIAAASARANRRALEAMDEL